MLEEGDGQSAVCLVTGKKECQSYGKLLNSLIVE